jgi:hypothetical protein
MNLNNDKTKNISLFIISMIVSTTFFMMVFNSPTELIIENKNFDLVLVSQSSGYFEFTFNPLVGKNIEIVLNKELFDNGK